MRRYLYSTHWDVPAAFAKLKNLFKLRVSKNTFTNKEHGIIFPYFLQHENPDFFVTKPLDHYKHYIRSKCKTILPKKDKYGRRVFLIQYGLVDTSLHSIQDLTVMDDAWFEIFFDDVETQKKGMAIIIDSKGYTLKMMKYASPGNMKVLSTRGDYVPSNVYEFHMVNTPALMSGALKMVVPLLSKNVKKGIQFHSNYSTLHSSLGKECIPSQYGGDTELDYNFGLDLMDKNYDLLNEMHKYGWVETENDGKSGSKNKKK